MQIDCGGEHTEGVMVALEVIGGVIVLYRESPELREKAAQKEKNLKQAARRAREKALRESRSNKRVKVRVTKAKR